MARIASANRIGQWVLHLVASLQPYFIVFAASACGLIIEIVAGRLLAPSIGVSLYTWTSIIGVVLAGISAGNYLGGRVADRFPSVTALAIILLAGGLSSLSVLPLVALVSQAFQGLPIISRVVLLNATLFFLPSLILGMVTPMVVKLQLRDLASTGNVVGRVYALSTAGAIFGTFLTGFVLIQWIGTRSVLLGVSLVLVLLALSLKDLWRSRWLGWSLLAVFVGVGSFSYLRGDLNGPCQRETNYYCIRIGDYEVEGRMVKTLALDWLLHSYVDLDDPSFLAYSYEKVFADVATMMAEPFPGRAELRVLFIGGGGYTMPRFLEVHYPQSTLEVVEIDPEVTEVAFQYLGLPRETNIVTYNEDARTKVLELPGGRYDLVIGDAFNDVSVPYHLTTLQFNQQVKGLLKDQGIYMVNLVDKLHSGRFLRAYVNTLQRTFPQVYVLRDDAYWDSDQRYTYVVVGSLAPLDVTALQEVNLRAGRVPVAQLMPGEAFQAWQASRGNIVLTDDYVPVENLLAPLYLESR